MNFLRIFIASSGRNSSHLNEFLITIYAAIVLAAISLPVTYCCVATPPVTTPTPVACCSPLVVTPTNNTNLADGIMVFTYNSDTCRTSTVATCSEPTITPPLQLMAGITVNQVNFISFAPNTVSISLVCNNQMRWQTGSPPLTVSTIQCILSNPA